MALLDLWKKSRQDLEEKRIHQLLNMAGTGKLSEGGATSQELRSFLAEVPSSFLARYVEECLTGKFEQSGFVLQDLVNEIGRRLGFQIEHGRYHGSTKETGNDGAWQSGSRHILVEVKTTDAYRINLDTVAGYRTELVASGKMTADTSSVLIVVGRHDTGDLEAQIRGSQHAWSVRLISADALLRLLRIKETVEDPTVFDKIVSILTPEEFTRVDRIVELVFRTAEDIIAVPPDDDDGGKDPTPRAAFNDACVEVAEKRIGRALTKASRSAYASSDGKVVAVCVVSKLHKQRGYWFAFHPRQKEQLEKAQLGFIILGCGSPKKTLVIPWAEFSAWVEGMNKTELEDRYYWHVIIDAEPLQLVRRRGEPKIPLNKYVV